jgi:hypothetical protein
MSVPLTIKTPMQQRYPKLPQILLHMNRVYL